MDLSGAAWYGFPVMAFRQHNATHASSFCEQPLRVRSQILTPGSASFRLAFPLLDWMFHSASRVPARHCFALPKLHVLPFVESCWL